MTKRVLVNGCSFTFGHGDTEDRYTGEVLPPKPWVWPTKLVKLFDQPVTIKNISKGGASNNRIVRTTIEGVKEYTPHAVIVQWTSPYRSEWYNELWETYFGLIPTGSIEDVATQSESTLKSFGTPNLWISADKLKQYGYESELYNNVTKASQYWQAYMLNYHEAMISFCKDVLLLQNFLDKRNIPYVFTSMSTACMLGRPIGGFDNVWEMIDGAPLPFLDCLKAEIDESKWTRYSFSHMMNDNIVSKEPYDPHPNDKGHELIAREMHKEIVKRGLLKDN